MQKSPHPCPTATEDASRAVAGAHAVGGLHRSRAPVRSLARSRPADGRGPSHESISLIASARQRYVRGGYDVIPPRSLAMGVVGIVYAAFLSGERRLYVHNGRLARRHLGRAPRPRAREGPP